MPRELLDQTIEINDSPYRFMLGESEVEIHDLRDDDAQAPPDIVTLRPATKEEASRLAMALRLSMQRMNAIAERFGA